MIFSDFGGPVQELVWKAADPMAGKENCPCKKRSVNGTEIAMPAGRIMLDQNGSVHATG